MPTVVEIKEWQRRTDAFRATPIGAAFFRFRHKLERASRMDAEDNFLEDNRKATRAAHEEAQAAERELRALLEPVSGMVLP